MRCMPCPHHPLHREQPAPPHPFPLLHPVVCLHASLPVMAWHQASHPPLPHRHKQTLPCSSFLILTLHAHAVDNKSLAWHTAATGCVLRAKVASFVCSHCVGATRCPQNAGCRVAKSPFLRQVRPTPPRQSLRHIHMDTHAAHPLPRRCPDHGGCSGDAHAMPKQRAERLVVSRRLYSTAWCLGPGWRHWEVVWTSDLGTVRL